MTGVSGPDRRRGSSSRFPETRLSVIDRIRSDEPEVRRQGFDSLTRGYWKPIYKYIRLKWRASSDEAEDLTQGFLAAVFAKRYFDSFDPDRARFRTFLRTCLDRYVMNERKAAARIKRGGNVEFVGLDFETAEGELLRREPKDPLDVEDFFRQELVRDLFARTVNQLRGELATAGKAAQYRLFERYDLDSAAEPTYADLAAEFGIPVTQVTNHLAAVRRRFRSLVLENLQEISGSDHEFREDARELFGVEIS